MFHSTFCISFPLSQFTLAFNRRPHFRHISLGLHRLDFLQLLNQSHEMEPLEQLEYHICGHQVLTHELGYLAWLCRWRGECQLAKALDTLELAHQHGHIVGNLGNLGRNQAVELLTLCPVHAGEDVEINEVTGQFGSCSIALNCGFPKTTKEIGSVDKNIDRPFDPSSGCNIVDCVCVSGVKSICDEEINRVLTDQISDILFTTEKSAMINLKREGISSDK
ncbi:hypothetical protein LCGC14_2988150, partial [marine sediment metagenome]